MKKLRIGIVGLGAISEFHISALQKIDSVEIACACDIDNKKKSIINSINKNTIFYENYDEMLEKTRLDSVHILTPHYLHSDMILKAIQQGISVLSEKPAGINMEEINRVNDYIKSHNSRVGIVLQNRLNPATVKAKEIINSGSIGNIICAKAFLTWNRNGDYYSKSLWRGKLDKEGGGLLINQAIHTLDLLYYFGGDVKNISGSINTHKNAVLTDVEDTAEVFIKFKNESTGIFFGSNCYGVNSPVFIELICEKGILTIEDESLYLRKDHIKTLVCHNSVIIGDHDYWGTSHFRLIQKFYESFSNPEVEYIKYEEGIPSAKICFEVYRNAKMHENPIEN